MDNHITKTKLNYSEYTLAVFGSGFALTEHCLRHLHELHVVRLLSIIGVRYILISHASFVFMM